MLRRPERGRSESIILRGAVGIGLILSVALVHAHTTNPFVNVNASGAASCTSVEDCKTAAIVAHEAYIRGGFACELFGFEGVHVVEGSVNGPTLKSGGLWEIILQTECDDLANSNGDVPHIWRSFDPCGHGSPFALRCPERVTSRIPDNDQCW